MDTAVYSHLLEAQFWPRKTPGIVLPWKQNVLVNCWVHGLSNSMSEEMLNSDHSESCVCLLLWLKGTSWFQWQSDSLQSKTHHKYASSSSAHSRTMQTPHLPGLQIKTEDQEVKKYWYSNSHRKKHEWGHFMWDKFTGLKLDCVTVTVNQGRWWFCLIRQC